MKNTLKFLVDHRLITVFVLVLLILMGLVTSPYDFTKGLLPRAPVSVDALPYLGENQQIVYTKWSGKSPRDMEDQITYPLTTNLLGITGVKSVRGNSMFGFSSVYVIFEDDVDSQWARSRILEKLYSLPKNLLPIGIQPKLGPDATALGQVFWYTLEGRNEEGKTTGGWDLHELRSVQDYYVKNALSSVSGVAEVASVGGFVQEYHVDADPEQLRRYNISLEQLATAVRKSNHEVGAQTIEINNAEYFVRGLGYVQTLADIENSAVISNSFTPVRVKDVARVSMGPAERRGILDKGGAEVVGGVVTAQYTANTMEVGTALKQKIIELGQGLPTKELRDGSISKLTIVPFYDRTVLTNEILTTLGDALLFEILIAIVVITLMLRRIRFSFLVSSLVPLAVLFVFLAMRLFGVAANIVALAGIAIAIGTMVDLAIILVENVIRSYKERKDKDVRAAVLTGTNEVSGAILTAGLTTIISFLPVFSLTGIEGKLFHPLAFTKTMALAGAIILTLLVLPPLLVFFLKDTQRSATKWFTWLMLLIAIVAFTIFKSYIVAAALVLFLLLDLWLHYARIEKQRLQKIERYTALGLLWILLAVYWKPLGITSGLIENLLFILLVLLLVFLPIFYLKKFYEPLLRWILAHKFQAISVPGVIISIGVCILFTSEKEFMPPLDEGDFLLMPTSMPHTGISEVNSTLKKLDMAVAALPEVAYAVGKAGRVESALDPAPLSMYENLISIKPEYILDDDGEPMRFKIDDNGAFLAKSGASITSGSGAKASQLISDNTGQYYRNWREHIRSTSDIWQEIVKVTTLPGVTTAPFLQPIATRQIMLQSGMRANMGIKIKGPSLEAIEIMARQLESEIRKVPQIVPETVFAERPIGKPYLIVNLLRDKISRYGLSVHEVQETLEITVGGKIVGQTIEGRERYNIRVRYPREVRNSPEDLSSIDITLSNGKKIPLSEVATIDYERGPQYIRSEESFLTSFVTFAKSPKVSEVSAIKAIQKHLESQIASGEMMVPDQVNYEFSGMYENYLNSKKTLSFVIPITLIVILLILYMQFRSVSTAMMVFSGVAVAFGGGFLLLWLFGQGWFMNFDLGWGNFRDIFHIQKIDLSVAVWVGFIALFGIATDDGVVMATYLNTSFALKKPKNNNEIYDAVAAAGKKRIKPCLMTTATTVLALLPLFTSVGKGSALMIAMAVPCLGGMSVALITLFIVPLLYGWREELKLKTPTLH